MNQPGMQVDISKATDMVCKCGSKLFRPVMRIKTLSALVSPTGQEAVIPVQVYACIKCDTVPDKFNEDIDGIS